MATARITTHGRNLKSRDGKILTTAENPHKGVVKKTVVASLFVSGPLYIDVPPQLVKEMRPWSTVSSKMGPIRDKAVIGPIRPLRFTIPLLRIVRIQYR
eukprot:scaffold574_cov190-Amphora_coffeaeformis.AAC.20